LQEKTEEKSSPASRLHEIYRRLGKNWADVAKKLGRSESYIYAVCAGRSGVSQKVLYRIEQLEREIGIKPPPANYPDKNLAGQPLREEPVGTEPANLSPDVIEALLQLLQFRDEMKTIIERMRLMDQWWTQFKSVQPKIAAKLERWRREQEEKKGKL
jgi:transcriptional regulator with XRE-family HTH domain